MSNQYLDCYTRVSTDKQKEEGYSLEVQEGLGRRVAEQLGLEFRHRNEGSRSSTIHYREVLEEVKVDIQSGKVKNLWIQDRSRMFRDIIDGLLFRRDYLERYKIALYEGVVPKKIDFNDEDEMVMYDIITRLQQYENKKRSERSQRGKLFKLTNLSRTKPVFLGGTPLFGYESKNKLWSINKEESKWVKFIFDAYEKGKSSIEIKHHLDREGVAPRRTGSGLWNPVTLQKMLRNKTYTGIHEQYIKKVEKRFSYKVPKIINVGQFNRVQKILDANQKHKDNNKKHYSLLGDFLVCECGRTMGSRHLKSKSSLGYEVNTRTYYCLSKTSDWKSGNKTKCKNVKSLQMDSLNQYVMDFVKDKVSKSHILKEKFKNEIMEDKFQKMKDLKETEKRLEQRLQRLQKDIESIEDNIADLEVQIGLGKKDRNIVQRIITRYEEELFNRRNYYEETEKQIDDLGHDRNWLNWIEKYGESIDIQTSNEHKQKEFLRGVLEKITIKGDYGTDRNGKSVQNGHTVDFTFKLKIVEDEYEVIDATTSPRTYRVREGKKVAKSDEVMKFISKRNRTKKKN